MALSFNSVKGEAERSKTPSYKMKDGENRIRIVGGVLGRYIYWVPKDGQKSPVECLSFNRETEKFDNKEKDWVKEYFPDLKPEWAYASLCYDPKAATPEIMIFNHKKKLFNAIIGLVEDLDNPGDLETGWDIVFTKAKTGPKVFNVEYTLQQMKCSKSKGPVSDEAKALFAAHPSIDDVLKRAPAEDIKKYLDNILGGAPAGKEGEKVDDAIPDDFES